MRHEEQVRVVERILALLDSGQRQMADEDWRSPIEAYTSEQRLVEERAAVFQRQPVMVAHGSMLREAGAFVTHDLSGVPLLVLRDGEGTLRGFVNVCRHRGARLVREPRGAGCKALVCPYHGWVYRTDGALEHIPHRDAFPSVDQASSGLVEVAVAERHGFVWAMPSPDLPLDLEAHFGPLDDELASLQLDTHALYSPIEKRFAMNWKLAVDLFLESYHFKRAHGRTIYPTFMDNQGLFDFFGPHVREVNPKRKIVDLRDVDRDKWDLRTHSNIVYFLFPNTFVLMQDDHFSIQDFYPTAVGETRVRFFMLIPSPPETDKAKQHWDKNSALSMLVVGEDFTIGEEIQRGLATGVNDALTFGRCEHALHHFHRNVERLLAEGDA